MHRMNTPTRTPFQTLHLARLADLFDVDLAPSEGLSGDALDAWMLDAEDRVFEAQTASHEVLSRAS